MLFGGYSSCQGCGCVPCQACTRTCTEPQTGTPFEVVYTQYSGLVGAEIGNPSDGYLTATGDSDTSSPSNGMDGTGPWFQQVGGGFTDGGSSGGGTRFPCTYRFSFWRRSFTLGPTSPNNPPSTALTKNVITVNVSYGAVVFPDGRVFTPADGLVELASIPLVSGGASASDPRTNEGTVSFALRCQNVETQFSVQARIEWNTQKRQHVLYGIVRECYEEENPCAATCSVGLNPPPDEIYLTISDINVPDTMGAFGTFNDQYAFLNQTFVLSRQAGICTSWFGTARGGECDPPFAPGVGIIVYASSTSGAGFVYVGVGRGNDCLGSVAFRLDFSGQPLPICGEWSRSGTSTDISKNEPATGGLTTYIGSFNWSITS